MTIFGSSNRGGHIAGAGHTAAGMVRRATAPAPPQAHLDATQWSFGDAGDRPPTSSINFPPADGRNGFRPPTSSVAEDTRADQHSSMGRRFCESDRKDSLDGTQSSWAGTQSSWVGRQPTADRKMSFNGRKSMEAFHSGSIEDENRYLREELSRLQTNAIDALHRRPMAAIAGGGFRGPTSKEPPKQCMCDSLRGKLARIRQELREARGEQRLPSQGGFPVDIRDNEAQTSPKLAKPADEIALYQPPQTAPSNLSGAARLLTAAVRRQSSVDAPTQTDSKTTADVSTEIVLCTSHVDTQTAFEKGELGVQAGCGISHPANAETQTASSPKAQLLDTASQATATGTEIAVQAGQAPAIPATTASQTEAAAAGVEVEVQATATATASSMQTDVPGRADVACEAKIEEKKVKPKVKNSCSAAIQTIPPTRCVAAVQTKAPSKTASATQVTPPPGIDKSCQAEDDRLEAALKREARHEAKIAELEARVAQLLSEKDVLKSDLLKSQEAAETFQQLVNTKAFGQMNVTILCPRAECTVSGERVEMDSWNPKRLRDEFEREVLPRFTKVFVEESNGSKPPKARSEAVDKAMQDFAETFRERLSAMLSAPNAAAAVQAAAATKAERPGSKGSTSKGGSR